MKKPAANPKKKREKSQKKKVSGLTWCDDSKSTSLKPTSVDSAETLNSMKVLIIQLIIFSSTLLMKYLLSSVKKLIIICR